MKKLFALLLVPLVAYGADIGQPGTALNQGQMIGGIGADGLFHFLLVGNDGGLTISGGSSGVVTQGSTTSGQSGMLSQGAVTTAAPSYTTAQTSPLSLTTAGGLRTTESNWPTTVDTNSGNKSASTPRFVIATDQPNLTTNLNVDVKKSVGNATTTTGQVTTSGSAGTLVAANATRRRAILKNTDTTITVYVGPATVTTANGMPLKAGESIEWRGVGLIQVIAASGTPVVAYMDESD